MASICVLTDPESEIDYSLVDGRVREFVYKGEKLYDEEGCLESDDWKSRLVELVQEQQLNVDRGDGLHAFVYRMIKDGLIVELEN